MLRRNLSLRIAGPTLLVSLVLLTLCLVAAVYLYREQATAAEILRENVSSTQAAHDLENILKDLATLLQVGDEQAGALHPRIRLHQAEVRQLADKGEEQELTRQLDDALERYLRLWHARRPSSPQGAEDGAALALQVVEAEALPLCGKLQAFNARQSDESAAAHHQTVQWLVFGLVGVGTLGAVGGVVLGYGVARSLRRSIYHLSVRVHDAAAKLGQEVPAVSVIEDVDLLRLDRQVHGVAREIEQVVTRLQEREREVLRAEQLAAVGQLAAGLAHELRNPLTSIKLLVQTHREEAEIHNGAAEDLVLIEQEIRRLERCLQNFLDFARPPQPRRRPLDLAEPIQRTLALIAGRARKQQVVVRFTPPPVPVVADADAEQLQQLLVNLTLNALDVMPRGGVLEIVLGPPEHGQLELHVLDTGPGIPAELLPRLFQPFVSSKETGLGLGLVISRRIAEGHGGSLRAFNRPLGGACLALRLPLGA